MIYIFSKQRIKLARLFSSNVAAAMLLMLGACAQDVTEDGKVMAAPANVVTAVGNSERGRRFFIQCQACHTITENGGDRTGPNLWQLIGRNAGTLVGYSYSDSLAQADFEWTPEKLDAFLADPNGVVPGTNMIFAGILNEAMRRDIVAFLADTTAAD